MGSKFCPPTINLRQVTFKILSLEVVYPPATYGQLFQPADAKTITLNFLSPTSFRRKGHHFPLPLPFNVFHSYLRRWNAFSNNPFNPDPFLT
ncbi:MAG: CRISPR system precrRNA processing endoribonuclease RAMP protein Cas6 [Hydrococcus sp. RM1_1_31]|nr:CRISPR system precrRNA processing endoribonuclease RAMP protein Cas6 [Hydrococcus sp. RM1_1_31]